MRNHCHSPGLENLITPKKKKILVLIRSHPLFPQPTLWKFTLLLHRLTFSRGKKYSKNVYSYVFINILDKYQLHLISFILLPRILNIWVFMISSPSYVFRKIKVGKHANLLLQEPSLICRYFQHCATKSWCLCFSIAP